MGKFLTRWISDGGNFLEEADIGGEATPMPRGDIDGVVFPSDIRGVKGSRGIRLETDGHGHFGAVCRDFWAVFGCFYGFWWKF